MTKTTALTPVTRSSGGQLQNPDFVKRFVGGYPMRRVGEPVDAAAWRLFGCPVNSIER
jgi:hypothetical protein